MVKIKFSDGILARYAPDKGEALVDKELRKWGTSLGDASVEYTFDSETRKYHLVPATDLGLEDTDHEPNFIIRRDSVKSIHGYDIILRRDVVQYPFLDIKIVSPSDERTFLKHFVRNEHCINGYEIIIKPAGAKIVEESTYLVGKHFENGIYLNTRSLSKSGKPYASLTLDLIIQDCSLYYDELSPDNKLVEYLKEKGNLNAFPYDGDWSIIESKRKSNIERFDKVLGLILKFLEENNSCK